MKTCNKCKIEINTIREYCPLCHQLLEGENDPNHVEMFLEKDGPRIPVSPKAQRIIAFIFMFAMAVLGVINIVDGSGTLWSLIPIGGIVYAWIILKLNVFSRLGSVMRITFSSIMLSLLLIFLNFFIDDSTRWSINYTLPAIIMVNNTLILLILLIRKRPFYLYAFQLLLLILLSLIPLLLYFLEIADRYTISVITFTHGIIILVYMIIFYPKVLKEIFKKIFHV